MREHRWNYRVVTIKPGTFKKQDDKNVEIEDQLNRLGTEGWELINVIQNAGSYPTYYLKRKF